MSTLVQIEEYDEPAISICPKGTKGESIELGGLVILLPAQPSEEEIVGYGKPDHMQLWERILRQRSCLGLSLWMSGGRCLGSFEKSFPYIEEEFAVGVRLGS